MEPVLADQAGEHDGERAEHGTLVVAERFGHLERQDVVLGDVLGGRRGRPRQLDRFEVGQLAQVGGLLSREQRAELVERGDLRVGQRR